MLYGIILILDSFLGMASVYVGYYLWVFYQILIAIVVIFVGIRLYSASRKIRVADLDLIKRGRVIPFTCDVIGMYNFRFSYSKPVVILH